MKLSIFFMNSFLIISLVASIGAGFYNYSSLNEVLTEQVYSHLETTAQSRANHIETFLDKEKQEVIALSNDVVFEELLIVDKSSPEYSERYERLKKQINGIMEIDEGIHELFVLDKTGKIVLSNNEENIGLDKSNDSYFIYGKEKTYIKDAYYSETIRKKIITISSPTLDDETNEFLGVVVMRIELTELDKITTDRTGLGETGESYIINKEKNLITSSRFLENEILLQKADTINAENCLKMLEKEHMKHVGHNPVKVFLDYRGENVLGTHFPIHEMNWCVLAEIDEAEALGKPRDAWLKNSIIIMIITIVAFGLIGFFIGEYLDRKYALVSKSSRGGRK